MKPPTMLTKRMEPPCRFARIFASTVPAAKPCTLSVGSARLRANPSGSIANNLPQGMRTKRIETLSPPARTRRR